MVLLDLYSLWPSGSSVVATNDLVVLYQADIIVDGVAASTEFSRVRVTLNQELKEHTRLSDPARWYVPKHYSIEAQGEVLLQWGEDLTAPWMEQATAGPLSHSPLVVTIAPDLAVGNEVYIFRGVGKEFEEDGTLGEVLRADVTMGGAGDGRCVAAKRLLRAAQTAAAGTGEAVHLGPVSAGQALRAALHVIGTTGTPAGTTFSLVSAPDPALSAPTTRASFAAGTSDRLGEWLEDDASVTDEWWAVQWSGFAGTQFTASISAGVQ